MDVERQERKGETIMNVSKNEEWECVDAVMDSGAV